MEQRRRKIREVEQKLRESEERLNLALSTARMVAFDACAETGNREVLGQIEQVYGANPENRTLDSFESFLDRAHPEDKDRLATGIADFSKTGVTPETEFRVVWPDGQIRWLMMRGVLIPDVTGAPFRTIGATQDITERKESDARLSMALAAAHMIAFDVDVQAGQRQVFGNAVELFGPNAESGSLDSLEAFMEMVHPEDRERFSQERSRAFETGVVPESEFRVVRPSGEVRWFDLRGEIIYDNTGAPLRMVGVNRDITERKQGDL